MSVLVLLLAGTLGIIYYTSYMDVYNKDQAMLERYIEGVFKGMHDGGFAPNGERPPAKTAPILKSVIICLLFKTEGSAVSHITRGLKAMPV